ncbi:bifunctional adenosylcobinamide kinase/adenosylcobinamide-phosphate guanylyltransferase [Litorivivens sp.]|uniref:bifunctional adenosylcobinamide kinase/adenosylcobinamide-phosphate guanylyltransferase n=1 Tax=Litorivivens sp. TaxID=2020868 RepID=UPI003566E9AB
MKSLILGGARSGKSRHAQTLAEATAMPVHFIATATAQDAEMQTRIARHRAERPVHWHTHEEPRHLAAVLQTHARAEHCLIVDCLSLWLSNLLVDEACLQREKDALLKVLPTLPGRIILVSNETGLGVVPLGALTRRFVDESGWLHQTLASHCDEVIMTVAGLPLHLKGSNT